MMTSRSAVARLSRYRVALDKLKGYGAAVIYSSDLADILGLTAAQVRKDFSLFRLHGKKKVGYAVDHLIAAIDSLLRADAPLPAYLCGCSHPVAVPLVDQLISADAISLAGVYDDSLPTFVVSGRTISVEPLDALISAARQNPCRFGIVASLPKSAQRMLDHLILAGFRGVLNLSGSDLRGSSRCMVTSLNVVRDFERLVYFVGQRMDGVK